MAGGDHEKMVRGHSCSSGTGHVFCSNPASDAHARPEDEGWDGDGLVGTGRNADHPAVNERSFRLTGLVLLLVCVGKVLLMDAWGLAPRDRYITFIILGSALLAVSFLYSKYRDTIRQFL
jgi:hypothetical protein